jgi:hypothetical protein
MLIGPDCQYEANSSFKLNVSLLEFEECRQAVFARVWHLMPFLVRDNNCILCWEEIIQCTTGFEERWLLELGRVKKTKFRINFNKFNKG